jgi:hypothetical protein
MKPLFEGQVYEKPRMAQPIFAGAQRLAAQLSASSAAIGALLAVVTALTAIGPANASTITFHFTGVITDNGAGGGVGPFGTRKGDTFTGSYSFDSEWPPTIYSGLVQYEMSRAPTKLVVDVGNREFTFDAYTIRIINDNIGNSAPDVYRLFTDGISGPDTAEFFFELASSRTDALASTALPLSPPDLSLFDYYARGDLLFLPRGEAVAEGFSFDVTSIVAQIDVPEPSTLPLIVSGLVLLALPRVLCAPTRRRSSGPSMMIDRKITITA